MKTVKLLIGLVLVAGMSMSVLGQSVEKQTNNKSAHIQFENTVHNFGEIMVGANGNVVFKFVNSGLEPLLIQGVRTSCGCTVAKKPSAPIMPGDSSEIKVKYDTRRLGSFRKMITVTSNADNASVVLTIQGKVNQKPQETPPVKKDEKGFTPTAK